MTTRLLLALAALLPGLPARAAPPVLTHLFPAGGRQGTTVTVTLGGAFERWPVRAWVEGAGVEAKAGKQKGQLTLTIAADATPGPRWLRVHDAHGASAPRRFVVGTLPEVAEQEPNDDARRPQPVAGDAVFNGRLAKPGDVDCFAVKLKKGQTLVASVLANRTLGSPMDGVLQVVSEKGFVLARNNDHAGLDPQVAHTAAEDGTHVVRLFAFPAVPDAGIQFAGGERFIYRLTLTTGGFAESAWPLAVQRGKGLTVGLAGWNLTEKSSKAEVKEADGDLGLAVAKGVAGDAWVRLEPHPCVARRDGLEPQKLAVPVTVSGRLEKAGRKHLYEFAGRKGQRLEARVESAQAGFDLDGVLRLTDPDGKQLARAQAPALHRDPDLSVTLPRDGAYRLEVSDARGEGGPRHLYRLRLLGGGPDFDLSVTSDRFSLAPGKTLDVAVAVSRRNGFAADVELAAEGLPAGVSAEQVPAAKGAAKLTLRLSAAAKAEVGGGAIRIVGKAKGGPARPARAALTDPEAVVERLWLGVVAR